MKRATLMRGGAWSILSLLCGLAVGAAVVVQRYEFAFAAFTAAVVCVWRASVAQRRTDPGVRARTLRAIGDGRIRRVR